MPSDIFPPIFSNFLDLSRFNSGTLWIILAISLLLFGGVTLVLNYHWSKFGVEDGGIKKFRILYFMVAGTIIAVSILSIILYANI